MKALMIVVLAATLSASGVTTGALAQSARPDASPIEREAPTVGREAPTVGREAPADVREAPAASPRTVEVQRILGMRASTVIFIGAVLFFIVVLLAAEISRRTPRYRRSDIDPHR